MDASWQPDPTGRHQYRWWDGAGWTDSVADNGQSSVDPVGAGAVGTGAPATVIGGVTPSTPAASSPFPSGPTPVQSGGAPPWSTGTPSGGLPDYSATTSTEPVKQGGKGKWIALGLVVVAALGVVGFLVLGGDDGGGGGGSGAGRATLEITEDQRVVTRELKVKKGEAYRIRIEPLSDDLDVVAAVLVPLDEAEQVFSEFERLGSDESDFSDFDVDEALSDLTDGDELFSDGLASGLRRYGALWQFDFEGSGDAESDYIFALSDGTYTLTIGAGDEDETGKVVVIIEKYDGDLGSNYDDFTDTLSDDFFTDSDFFDDESGSYTGS